MKKLIPAAALAAVAAGALAAPSIGAATKTVAVKDDTFGPSSLAVKKGTRVSWVWKGKAPHNVKTTSGPARFASSTQVKGSFAYTFKKAGTYRLVCSIHAPGMKMTVKVS